eukprot:249479_1
MSTESEVIVIGCGILGASAAYSILKSNVSTTILEQYSTHFHQYGASYGQGRIWRVAYPNPIYSNMMIKSLKIWKEIENITSTKLLSYCGGLDFGHKNLQSLKDITNTLNKNNFKFEILSSQQTNKRFNPIQIPSNFYSIHVPNDYGVVYADKALNAIVECIQKLNGTIKYNTKVIKIEIHKNSKYKYNIYTNNSIVYKCNNIIFACGAYKLPPVINTYKNNYNYKIINRINDIIKPIELNVVCIKPSDNNIDISTYPSWVEYGDGYHWYGLITKQYSPYGVVNCMKIGYGYDLPHEKYVRFPYEHIMKYVKEKFGNKWDVFAFKKCYITYNKNQPEDDLTIDRIVNHENLFIMYGHSHGFKHAPEMGNIIKHFVINNQKPHNLFSLTVDLQSKL